MHNLDANLIWQVYKIDILRDVMDTYSYMTLDIADNHQSLFVIIESVT
jgi:hypothetical protein